jgi:hypothetical protein
MSSPAKLSRSELVWHGLLELLLFLEVLLQVRCMGIRGGILCTRWIGCLGCGQ